MRESRPLARGLLICVLFAAAWGVSSGGGITLIEFQSRSRFSDASEDDAIKFACAAQDQLLEEFFISEGLPFRRNLLKIIRGEVCHVYFRPTLSGFRAAPEDDPVRGLYFSVDSRHLGLPPDHRSGSAFGAVFTILTMADQPLQIEISTSTQQNQTAAQLKFEEDLRRLRHRVSVHNLSPSGVVFQWTQDLLKAGYSQGQNRNLVPHRLFEGEPEGGELFDSIVRELASVEGNVRSKLAWDGGDLLFTRDPRNTEGLVMFYGNAAKSYWGRDLTQEEYEYVLCLEFGADLAIDLSGLAPHVDYFVAFLSNERIALVSELSARSPALSRAALKSLLSRFRGEPPAELLRLQDLFDEGISRRSEIDGLLNRIRDLSIEWNFGVNHDVLQRLQSFVETSCPSRDDCFSIENRRKMMNDDPNLLGLWIAEHRLINTAPVVIKAHIELIASLTHGVPDAQVRRQRRKVRELESLGFRVILVPRLGGSEGGWPGVSYVNGLIIGRQVFVPAFGLGSFEERIFTQLQDDLPDGYSVVPVPAADVIARNGGLRCLAAITRGR